MKTEEEKLWEKFIYDLLHMPDRGAIYYTARRAKELPSYQAWVQHISTSDDELTTRIIGELHHASVNEHVLDPNCQGVNPFGPPVPAVRISSIYAALAPRPEDD